MISDPTEFRDLVSGRRRGIRAAGLRTLLRMAEAPYSLAVSWRNRRYDRRAALIHKARVPVISVGNLTLGGTGKTPMVKWLARRLLDRGLRVAIVSRGYRAAAGQPNDEALELADALPHLPHVQNPDRIAAASRATEEHNAQVLILDDGFQHRRLARDLDIVLLDALEPFGYEHVFPRGTLREPIAGLRRADVVCLSRANTIAQHERDTIRRRVEQMAPQAAWCELVHAPSRLINAAGDSRPLEDLAGRRIAAFCGIGNPAGFRHTLTDLGCELMSWRELPDHCAYGNKELASLNDVVCGAEFAVCTHKDLVKLRRTELNGVPLWALAVEMRFLDGREAFEQALDRTVRPEGNTDERLRLL